MLMRCSSAVPPHVMTVGPDRRTSRTRVSITLLMTVGPDSVTSRKGVSIRLISTVMAPEALTSMRSLTVSW